jgi:DNA-binding IclR family transcriptional regulator
VYSLLGTATGRVFLAFLPDEAPRRWLEPELRDGLDDHGPEAVGKIVAAFLVIGTA